MWDVISMKCTGTLGAAIGSGVPGSCCAQGSSAPAWPPGNLPMGRADLPSEQQPNPTKPHQHKGNGAIFLITSSPGGEQRAPCLTTAPHHAQCPAAALGYTREAAQPGLPFPNTSPSYARVASAPVPVFITGPKTRYSISSSSWGELNVRGPGQAAAASVIPLPFTSCSEKLPTGSPVPQLTAWAP